MQLYYIRHAQSENNQAWETTQSAEGRRVDPDITLTGARQARALAAYLHAQPPDREAFDPQNLTGFGITHLYCSLMRRAIATGAILARALDLPLRGWVDIHETGGMYDLDLATDERLGKPGLSQAEVAARYPELVWPEDAMPDGWWNRPHEPFEARQPRAEQVLAQLLARHADTGDRVAMVSHGAFYNHLLRVILGVAPEINGWFSLNNASITRIDFTPEEVRIIYSNRAHFLPLELIT